MKNIIGGVLIGLALGMWWGVNIGKGREFYSNPFKSSEEAMQEKAEELLEETKRALRERLK